MTRWLAWVGVAGLALFTIGCELDVGGSSNKDDDVESGKAEQNQEPSPFPETPEKPHTSSGIVWLDADVSHWPVTTDLKVNISGGLITLNYGKANKWPSRNGVNANPWIIVNRGGVLYAATWEWMKTGQTTKSTAAVHGSHINHAPLNSFRPRSGEIYGFMVSSLARGGQRTVNERSHIVFVRWP